MMSTFFMPPSHILMNHIKQIGSKEGTVVYIHGNSSSANIFKSIVECDTLNHTAVVVDLPGHGKNKEDYQNLEDFSIENYNRLCADFINSIDDDIILAGNSFGGHIAIEIAPQIKRLKGVLIFGTPPLKRPLNIEEVYLPIKESQVFFMENPSDEEIKAMSKVATYNETYSHIIESDFKNTNPKVRAAIAKDVMNNAFANEYEIFTQLQVPKYIIAGKQDPSINMDYLKQVVEVCDGSCSLIEFDECGHYPSLEQPELFTSTINKISETVFK